MIKLNKLKLGFTICKCVYFTFSGLAISVFGKEAWLGKWSCLHSPETILRNGALEFMERQKRRLDLPKFSSALHIYAVCHDAHVYLLYVHLYDKKGIKI